LLLEEAVLKAMRFIGGARVNVVILKKLGEAILDVGGQLVVDVKKGYALMRLYISMSY
jgi:hypothetical protein